MAPLRWKAGALATSAQLQHEGIFFVAVYQALLQSRRHAHDAGNIGSGALTFFLRAALQQALGPNPFFTYKNPQPWPWNLCADRQKIRLQLCQVDFTCPAACTASV